MIRPDALPDVVWWLMRALDGVVGLGLVVTGWALAHAMRWYPAGLPYTSLSRVFSVALFAIGVSSIVRSTSTAFGHPELVLAAGLCAALASIALAGCTCWMLPTFREMDRRSEETLRRIEAARDRGSDGDE